MWAWGTLGRPVALLLLEALAFCALTLALDWDSRHHALERHLAALRRMRRRCAPGCLLCWYSACTSINSEAGTGKAAAGCIVRGGLPYPSQA